MFNEVISEHVDLRRDVFIVFIRKNELSYREESNEYERQQSVPICTD